MVSCGFSNETGRVSPAARIPDMMFDAVVASVPPSSPIIQMMLFLPRYRVATALP